MITVPRHIVQDRSAALIEKGYRPDSSAAEIGVNVFSRKRKDGSDEFQSVAFRVHARDW